MTKKQKNLWKTLLAVAAVFTVAPAANAMHIMEGYLPPAFCVAWGVVCLPFLFLGFRALGRIVKEDRKTMTLIAMAGAFVFVISSLKIPSVTGCDPLWTLCSQCAWHHRTDFSGDPSGAWRSDDTGSQLFFHGNRRSHPVLAHLQGTFQDKGKP